jgi:hypothetical protein
VQQAPLVFPVTRVTLAQLELLVSPVLLVTTVTLELLVTQVTQVTLVQPELPVLMVPTVPMALTVLMARLTSPELLSSMLLVLRPVQQRSQPVQHLSP